jgi:hypothetical protein
MIKQASSKSKSPAALPGEENSLRLLLNEAPNPHIAP